MTMPTSSPEPVSVPPSPLPVKLQPSMSPITWPSPPISEGAPPAAREQSAQSATSAGQCSCAATHSTEFKSSSRRKGIPHRSLPYARISHLTESQKRSEGIIQLDIYGMYKTHPSRLLFNRVARRRAVAEWAEKHLLGIQPPASRPVRRRGRPNKRSTAHPPAPRSTPVMFTPNPSNSTTGAPIVTWTKGDPIPIPSTAPFYHSLTPEEVRTCSTLRLMPENYLKIKEILLTASKSGPFKKRDAQKWCRIDVNKTGKLYDWYCALGWLVPYGG